MSTPASKYENNERAAHAVSRHLDALRPSPQRFSLRPYNRFDPAFTTWWFVPSTDWPAYSRGKLFLQSDTTTSEEPFLTAGYYLEKGLGSVLRSIPEVKASNVMDDGWYWHRFMKSAAVGEAEHTVAEVAQRSGRPVVIHLAGWPFNSVPQLDEELPPHDDALELVVGSGPGDVQPAELLGTLFRPLSGCTSLREIGQRFDQLEKLDFYWIDLTIGIKLKYGTPSTGEWGAPEIWRNALEPWDSWVH